MKLISEELVGNLHTLIQKGIHPGCSFELVTQLNWQLSQLKDAPKEKEPPKKKPKKSSKGK